jgi:hypothetical protein
MRESSKALLSLDGYGAELALSTFGDLGRLETGSHDLALLDLTIADRRRVDVLPDHLLQVCGLHLRRAEGGGLPADASLFEIVADFERRIITEHLEATHWSQTEAAERLRVPLSTLNQKIKRLNIEIRKRAEAGKGEKA